MNNWLTPDNLATTKFLLSDNPSSWAREAIRQYAIKAKEAAEDQLKDAKGGGRIIKLNSKIKEWSKIIDECTIQRDNGTNRDSA